MRSEQAEADVRDEETWGHPSPRFRLMRRAEVAAASVVVAALAGALSGIHRGPPVGAVVAASVAIAGVLAERFVQRRVRTWGYLEREDDLLVRRGVLFARLSVVPYGRMQFIDVTAGPVERSFGWPRSACTRRPRRATPGSRTEPGRRGEAPRSPRRSGRVAGRRAVSGRPGKGGGGASTGPDATAPDGTGVPQTSASPSRPDHTGNQAASSEPFGRRGLGACDAEWKLVCATHNLLKPWRHSRT